MATTPEETIQYVIEGHRDGDASKVLAEFAEDVFVVGHRGGEIYWGKDQRLIDDMAEDVGTASGPMTNDVRRGEVTGGPNNAVFHRTDVVQFPDGVGLGHWIVRMEQQEPESWLVVQSNFTFFAIQTALAPTGREMA